MWELCSVEQERRVFPMGLVPFFIRVVVAQSLHIVAALQLVLAVIEMSEGDATSTAPVLLVLALKLIAASWCLCVANPFDQARYKRTRTLLRAAFIAGLVHAIASSVCIARRWNQHNGIAAALTITALVATVLQSLALWTAVRALRTLQRKMGTAGRLWHPSPALPT